ncbi:hypothetical protein Dip518_000987 [Parelusimicrobium proximum]|uniref:hypothetical protein n=1 Tax=Parelusimicrobium proximum TaxID=3228953 RepID=UPI003D16F162
MKKLLLSLLLCLCAASSFAQLFDYIEEQKIKIEIKREKEINSLFSLQKQLVYAFHSINETQGSEEFLCHGIRLHRNWILTAKNCLPKEGRMGIHLDMRQPFYSSDIYAPSVIYYPNDIAPYGADLKTFPLGGGELLLIYIPQKIFSDIKEDIALYKTDLAKEDNAQTRQEIKDRIKYFEDLLWQTAPDFALFSPSPQAEKVTKAVLTLSYPDHDKVVSDISVRKADLSEKNIFSSDTSKLTYSTTGAPVFLKDNPSVIAGIYTGTIGAINKNRQTERLFRAAPFNAELLKEMKKIMKSDFNSLKIVNTPD